MVTDSPLFRAQYPFKSHYLDLDGLQYHYLDEGHGDPVIMLHGNPSWSFYYRHLVRDLRNSYRLIVPDHIGCGLSDKPVDSQYSFSLEQRVKDLDRLIDSLNLKQKITLIVHDWGGMIGMAWAVKNPQRIGRIVLLNTAAFHLPADKKLPLGLKICRETQFGAFLVQGLNIFARGAALVGCKRNVMSADLRRLYCSPYDNWRSRIATLRFVQEIPLAPDDRGYDLISETAEGLTQFADVPISLFWGERDFVFDRYFRDVWLKLYPNAQQHIFPDCGHYILEDAKEEVIPLIKQFLRDNPLKN